MNAPTSRRRSRQKIKIDIESNFGSYLFALALLSAWLGGVVLAAAGWMKALAAFFPPYALYLFAERLMQMGGMLR